MLTNRVKDKSHKIISINVKNTCENAIHLYDNNPQKNISQVHHQHHITSPSFASYSLKVESFNPMIKKYKNYNTPIYWKLYLKPLGRKMKGIEIRIK